MEHGVCEKDYTMSILQIDSESNNTNTDLQ